MSTASANSFSFSLPMIPVLNPRPMPTIASRSTKKHPSKPATSADIKETLQISNDFSIQPPPYEDSRTSTPSTIREGGLAPEWQARSTGQVNHQLLKPSDEDVTPQLPPLSLPLTPEWFPMALPAGPPPPDPSLFRFPVGPYRHPLVSDAPGLVWAPPLWAPLAHDRLHARSIQGFPLLGSVPPADLSTSSEIPKRVMEQRLRSLALPAVTLCEITNAGQLCHLRRNERLAVFLRSSVNFEKAFKHLSGFRDHIQHLIIGVKLPPIALGADLVDDRAIVQLLQTLPGLVECRLHGFTRLTKLSFNAALTHCVNLRILAITGTRVAGSQPRKVLFFNGRPNQVGGAGSLEHDTIQALIPRDGPSGSTVLPGQYLRFIDLSFQYLDEQLAKDVTALPGRRGELVIARELPLTTERYASGWQEMSSAIDGFNLQGSLRSMKPVAIPATWQP